METNASKLRQHLLLFTACTMIGGMVVPQIAHAQDVQHKDTAHHQDKQDKKAETATTVTTTAANAADANVELQAVRVIYKRNLVREKDIPSAITVLGANKIAQVSPTMGSIQTLLKLSPSVQAYAQGPGQSAPTLAVRGVKDEELAETLDGVPLTAFLGGQDYASNNVGGPVTLPEIDSVTVYPGMAPPDRSGFGTVGGTIAYTTKKPTAERYAQISGGYGSFDTSNLGFTINTGKWYNDPDAPETLILYKQTATKGYVSNTPGHYHNFMINTVKPFDDGLTQVGLTIIFNQGSGTVQTGPTPVFLTKQKWTYNFPLDWGFFKQSGKFLTTILSDKSYINQYLDAQADLFYVHTDSSTDSYAAPWTMDGWYPYAVNVQGPYNFFGDMGPGSRFYKPGYFTYNPTATFGSAIAGETSEYDVGWSNRIGFVPRLNIHLPHNTIAIGGLVDKDSGSGAQYVYGGAGAPENATIGYNAYEFGGGTQRTVYMGYIDDKIDLLNNKLHIEPGATVSAAYTSVIQVYSQGYDPGKFQNYTKTGEPYLGISYDLPYHVTSYVTFGKSSLFSPSIDYGAGADPLVGSETAPHPEIATMYEAGLRYDTPTFALSGDYYYQEVRDGFSQYQNYLLGETYYANLGGYLIRGLEFAGEAKLTPDLTLDANFSYENSDHTNSAWQDMTLANDQFGYGYKGTPLTNLPDYLANVSLNYEHGPYMVNLSGQYTGQQYLTYDYLTPEDPTNRFSGATEVDMHHRTPPTMLFNINASYVLPIHTEVLKSVKLVFTGLNMLNVHYYAYEYGNNQAQGGVYSILPEYDCGLIGPPRSLELDVVAKF